MEAALITFLAHSLSLDLSCEILVLETETALGPSVLCDKCRENPFGAFLDPFLIFKLTEEGHVFKVATKEGPA